MRPIHKVLLRVVAALVIACVLLPTLLIIAYAFVDPPVLPVLRREWRGETVERTPVPLEAISPALVRGVIMAEDARFCLHYGVDLRQLRIVVSDALAGRPSRGASTITMQTVKNLFLWPDRSYVRKGLEIPLAILFDLILSKDRILEIYLNAVQWGDNVYGIDAAAQRFFGRSAADLTEAQAYALATMLPAPAVRDPRRPSARQQGVIAHVQRELARAPWVFSCLSPPIRPS